MWPYPKFIAHRGAGTLAPENTLAALRCGLEHGYRAVEFDVMLARDGVPVVMHDAEFGRTVAGAGKVADYTAAQLLRMDAGCWFGARFVGEMIPSYAAFFEFCRAQQIWMNVEIKPASGSDAQTGATVARLTTDLLAAEAQTGVPLALPLLSSFSLLALQTARDSAPQLPRALLVDALPPDWLAQLQALDAVALHANQRHLSAAQARSIKQAGYGLMCYTVNDPARAAALFAAGVDAICTDRIDLFKP